MPLTRSQLRDLIEGGATSEEIKRLLADELAKEGLTTTLGQQVETSPIEVRPLERGGALPPSFPGTMPSDQPPRRMGEGIGVSPPPSKAEIAGEAGVEFRGGAPAGVRFLTGFGIDDRENVRALQKGLSEYYGQEIDVRQGPDTGEIEFFNPNTRRFQLVNPPGIDVGDLTSLSGDTLVIVPEIAAATGVAVLTRHPGATIGAGAAGAFAGEYARLRLGQLFGLNEEVSEAQMLLQASKMAGIAAGGGAMGLVLTDITKAINNLLAGRPPFGSSVTQLDERILMESFEAADRVNSRIGTGRLRYTTGQAMDDPDLLALEEMFRKSRSFGALGMFREFDQVQQAALRDFWRWLNQPYDAARKLSPAETGRGIQQVVKPRQEAARQGAEERVAGATEARDAAAEALPSRPGEQLGTQLRGAVQDRQAQLDAFGSNGAQLLDELANGVTIPNRATHKAAEALDAETQRALLPAARKRTGEATGPRVTGRREVSDDIRFLRESITGKAGPEYEEILAPLFDPNATFTFQQAYEALKSIDELVRISSKGLSAETPRVGALKLLRRSIEADVRQAIDGTPLLEAWDLYRAKIRAEKDLLDRTVLADIVGTDERVFKVSAEKVFATSFKGDLRDAAAVMDVIKDKPAVLQAYREGILDLYKREVIGPDGTLSGPAHRKFMKENEGKLAIFFPESNINDLNKIMALEHEVQRLAARQQETLNALRETFSGQIESYRPREVFTKIWRPGARQGPDIEDIKSLTRILKHDPEMWKAFQAEVLRDMGERITSLEGQNRILSFVNLDKYLHGTGPAGIAGRKEALEAVMGKQFMSDLETMVEALKIAQRSAPAVNVSQTAPVANALNHVARIWTGLFTVKGRALTAAKIIARRASNRVLLEAVLDPKKMRRFIKLANLSPSSRVTATILGELGGSALLMPQFGFKPSERDLEEMRPKVGAQ